MAWHPLPSAAQDILDDSSIDIAYVEPRNPEFRFVYDELKRRQVLEELRRFLSPLRLPRRVLVKTEECGAETIPYEPGQPVVVCYEYIAAIVKLAPPVATPEGISRENAIIGAFVQSVLQRVSYALFDVLEIPVWGREHDAADNLAAFIMLQFGKDLALRVLTGAVWFFEASDRKWTGSDFASEASPAMQRFFNYVCIAYGSDPETFAPVFEQALLETGRAGTCAREYGEVRYAFRKLILPHIDPEKLAKVRSMQWAMPEGPAN
jgi:hypothetical protein